MTINIMPCDIPYAHFAMTVLEQYVVWPDMDCMKLYSLL